MKTSEDESSIKQDGISEDGSVDTDKESISNKEDGATINNSSSSKGAAGSSNKGKKKEKKVTAAKAGKTTTVRRKRKHKPKGFPKRPLSAYNIFFRETREKIVGDNKGKAKDIEFQTMAKEIAARWKSLDAEERERVNSMAKDDMKRYREEVKVYEEEMVKKKSKQRENTENLRKMQDAEKKALEAEGEASDAAQLIGSSLGISRLSALDAQASGINGLAHALSSGGGGDLDAIRREQLQLTLSEELRSVEARAMQIRLLQAQLGFPVGTEGGNLGLNFGSADILQQGREADSGGTSSARADAAAAVSDYELMLLLQQRAASQANALSAASLLNIPGAMNLGLGGLNAGYLSQLQGMGGGLSSALQQLEQNGDTSQFLQNQDFLNRSLNGSRNGSNF